MFNVYIYGAGIEYNRVMAIISLYESELNVLGIVTTNRQKYYAKMDGFSCVTVDEIDKGNMDFIIVAVAEWQGVVQELLIRGVGYDQIVLSKVFFLPNFDLNKYLAVKKSRPTIFSNYCLGGGSI